MKVNIIAEAGVNHNGSLNKAKKMALEAKKAGADFVKFQIFDYNEIALKNLKKTNYQKNNTRNSSENQYEMLRKLSLSNNDFDKLIKYCKKIKIKFLASVFDLTSLNYLKKKSNVIKIGSSEISNFFLLKELGKINKKLIISTGMCDFKSVRKALQLLYSNGQDKKNYFIALQFSLSNPLKDVNILTMNKLKNVFKVSSGYSDHAMGCEAVYAAVALGAVVIEKHVTLNKNFSGPDHKISLNFKEFKKMVNVVRKITKTLKVKKGKLTKSEKFNASLVKIFF